MLAQDGLLAKDSLGSFGSFDESRCRGLFPVVKSKDFANKYKIDFNDGELAIGVEYSTGNCGDKIMYDWKLRMDSRRRLI